MVWSSMLKNQRRHFLNFVDNIYNGLCSFVVVVLGVGGRSTVDITLVMCAEESPLSF